EPGERERVSKPSGLRLGADVVAVVEYFGPRLLEPDHRLDLSSHRLARSIREPRRVFRARRVPLVEAELYGQVSERVMRARLVGDDVDLGAHCEHSRKDVGSVAEQANTERLAVVARVIGEFESVLDRARFDI